MNRRGLSSFDSLRGQKDYRRLTFRRNGVAVNTPVWFGLSDAKPVSRLRGSGQVYLEIVPASRRTR